MAETVKYKTKITLKHVSGKWLSHFYNGPSDFFPTLRDGNKTEVEFYLASSQKTEGSVNNGATIVIKCLEGGMSSYVWMGAFSDSRYVYYHEQKEDKTSWVISKEGDGDIRFGDTVTLKNVHYKDEYGFEPVVDGGSSDPYQLLYQTALDKDAMKFIVHPA